jgi:hypothetical protein
MLIANYLRRPLGSLSGLIGIPNTETVTLAAGWPKDGLRGWFTRLSPAFKLALAALATYGAVRVADEVFRTPPRSARRTG